MRLKCHQERQTKTDPSLCWGHSGAAGEEQFGGGSGPPVKPALPLSPTCQRSADRKGVASSCILWGLDLRLTVDWEGVGDENQGAHRQQLVVQTATATNTDLEFTQYRGAWGTGPTAFTERLLRVTLSSGVWWVLLAYLPYEGFGVTDLPMHYTKRLWLGKPTFLRIEYQPFASKF